MELASEARFSRSRDLPLSFRLVLTVITLEFCEFIIGSPISTKLLSDIFWLKAIEETDDRIVDA